MILKKFFNFSLAAIVSAFAVACSASADADYACPQILEQIKCQEYGPLDECGNVTCVLSAGSSNSAIKSSSSVKAQSSNSTAKSSSSTKTVSSSSSAKSSSSIKVQSSNSTAKSSSSTKTISSSSSAKSSSSIKVQSSSSTEKNSSSAKSVSSSSTAKSSSSIKVQSSSSTAKSSSSSLMSSSSVSAQSIYEAVQESGKYTTRDSVAAYLCKFDKLPSNYVGKDEGQNLYESKTGKTFEKWNFNPWTTIGVMIGGDKFNNYASNASNYHESLPEGSYREADVEYSAKNRGTKRLVYQSDCVIYYTSDHYETFSKLEIH